ncbi:MAG: FAD-dependent monooxygenase [Mariprofundaceae bacterium]|nr:FAD-dependent monooxygenase [Mariprofundaceae bacterium]
MAKTYDLIIVGGGIAGAALALELSRLEGGRPLKIAVIEAAPAALDSGQGPERVIALSHGSRCHLQSLGVWDEVRSLGAAPIRDIRIFEPGNIGTVDMSAREAGVEALGYVVELSHVIAPLRDALKEKVEWLCPARLQAMHADADGVQATVTHGKRTRTFSARLLVGADGTGSQVRRMAGISSLGWDHNRFGIVASVTPEKPHRDVAFECFRPAGPLAFLPLDDARCSIVWTETPAEAGRLMTADDAEFLDSLNRAAGDEVGDRLGCIRATGPRACFPFELRFAASCAAQRVALIGNAAHTVHPVAGQGMNLGLRDVAVLADAVTRAMHAGRDPGAAIVLEEFADRRKADFAAVIGFTEGVNTVFSGTFLPLRLLRGAGLGIMAAVSPVREFLLRQASGLGQMASLRRGDGHAA